MADGFGKERDLEGGIDLRGASRSTAMRPSARPDRPLRRGLSGRGDTDAGQPIEPSPVRRAGSVDFAPVPPGRGGWAGLERGGLSSVPCRWAKVKIYPDSAHGFLFQHHAEFAADVDSFLTRAG